VNSATLSQEFVSLYQYLSAKDDKRTREEVLQAEQRLKSMCTLSAYSMLMQQSGKPFRTLFPNIVKLIQLLTVIPATAERSFSCLRRVKTGLRSTMSQTRLKSMVILHANRLVLPHVDTVIDEFISLNDTRREVFGLPTSSSCSVQQSGKLATASLLETDD
jgi:hypothetical protein